MDLPTRILSGLTFDLYWLMGLAFVLTLLLVGKWLHDTGNMSRHFYLLWSNEVSSNKLVQLTKKIDEMTSNYESLSQKWDREISLLNQILDQQSDLNETLRHNISQYSDGLGKIINVMQTRSLTAGDRARKMLVTLFEEMRDAEVNTPRVKRPHVEK